MAKYTVTITRKWEVEAKNKDEAFTEVDETDPIYSELVDWEAEKN